MDDDPIMFICVAVVLFSIGVLVVARAIFT